MFMLQDSSSFKIPSVTSHHLIYELVMLPEGKMSSREGNVILYYDLRDKLIEEANKGVNDRHNEWSKKDKDKATHDIAFGALKFSMLNKENNRKEDFELTVGKSLSQTYARSINTSLTTLVVLSALFFVGSVATQDFALVLATGVIAGTYSSIFLATPLLVAVER